MLKGRSTHSPSDLQVFWVTSLGESEWIWKKVETIKEWQTPMNVKELRSRFIEGRKPRH